MPRRILALLFAALLVVGVVADVAKDADALRVHVICPEHGELLHLAASPGDRPSELRAAPADEHEADCEMAAMSGISTGWLLVGLPPVARPAPPAGDVAPLAAAATAPRHPLAYAPKTSPPGTDRPFRA